jgi:hypothetical protein
MKAIICGAIIAVFSWASAGHAENASREKCTCDPKPGEVQDHGAWVENATACWASVDEDLEWCRITAEALEGDTRHKQIIDDLKQAKDDPAALFDYLYASSQSSLAVEGEAKFANAKSELPAIMKSYAEAASKCVDLFLGKADKFEEGDFSCHVSGLTGWLRMSYRVGAIRFVFMIAPDA